MPASPARAERTDAIRDQILDAANERFRHYGYGKTTMAEVARDCGMSAANLYRYFESKQDIGAALACRCFADKEAALRRITEQSERPAGDRLRDFVVELVNFTQAQCSDQPRIDEMVTALSAERPDLVALQLKMKRTLVLQLLAEGNAAGEFVVRDLDAAADAVLAATVLFDYPPFARLYSLAIFQRRAREVGDLLLQGLRRR